MRSERGGPYGAVTEKRQTGVRQCELYSNFNEATGASEPGNQYDLIYDLLLWWGKWGKEGDQGDQIENRTDGGQE